MNSARRGSNDAAGQGVSWHADAGCSRRPSHMAYMATCKNMFMGTDHKCVHHTAAIMDRTICNMVIWITAGARR